jgi:hypothetical protein
MKFIRFVIFVIVASMFSTNVSAQTVYFNGPVEFAGTGCGAGSYTVSNDVPNILTIQFSAYDAAYPTDSAASGLQRSACSFAVPIHVPAGYQISTLSADWRVYGEGAVEFFREYFFAGEIGESKLTTPSGTIFERDQMQIGSCAERRAKDILLRVNSAVSAANDGNYNYIAIDSVDQSLALTLQLHVEKCRSPIPSIINLLL